MSNRIRWRHSLEAVRRHHRKWILLLFLLIVFVWMGKNGGGGSSTHTNANTGSENAKTESENTNTASENAGIASENADTASENADTASGNADTGSGNAGASSRKVNTASGKMHAAKWLYRAVVEMLAPQVIYAGDSTADLVANDLCAAIIPALSWYEDMVSCETMQQENYEWLAAQENAQAVSDAAGSTGEDASGSDRSGENSISADGSDSVTADAKAAGQISEDERNEVAAQDESASDAATGGTSGSKSEDVTGDASDGNTLNESGSSAVAVLADLAKVVTIDRDKLDDFDYLKSTFYQVDGTTSISSALLDASELLAMDMSLGQTKEDEPQILIYHTHSQEGYADSTEGDSSTTVVGVGEYLAELLTEQYGYCVLHHTGEYDVGDRDHAYTNAAPALEELLEEYPSIQVVIDLHRDGVSESTRLVTEINGKQTAQIMFFNGISYTTALGNISWLPNSYIEENLAFSLQLQLAAAEYYPGLTRKIYIKGYRYNMHYMPQSLLVEVGAQTNTVEEAMNAMEPLAAILDYVLSGASAE